jgi:hypothetical protein
MPGWRIDAGYSFSNPQVDEKTVLRWSLQDASMPVLRRGRVVRFPRERLLVWLEPQESRAARRSARGQHKSSAA